MSVNTAEDEVWRVVLLPGLEKGRAATVKSFSLPDPRTGRPQGFLLVNGMLLEMNRFKQPHSAWLVGDRLLADGGMFLATPYDPLFVLLPFLDRGRDKDESCPAGKFKELAELLYDGSTPALGELLSAAARGLDGSRGPGGEAAADNAGTPDAAPVPESVLPDGVAGEGAATAAKDGEGAPLGATTPAVAAAAQVPAVTLACLDQQLRCICDVREVDGAQYYRLNEDRVLAWLCCKFRRMQAALAPQVAGMEAPYAAAYVLGFLGEYVGDPWVGRVAKRLGIKDKELTGGGATGTTLQPTDGNTIGAARPGPPLAGGPPEKRQKTDPRAASKQAALAKQAVGTKKLTSFFTKK